MPQLPALLDGTVADNLRFAAAIDDGEPDVDRLLDMAGLDQSFAAREVDRLSVGEQQRVMIARALATEPGVLLLDEPTSALDERARDSIEGTILGLHRELDASIVVVTHDPAQARRLADWVGEDRRGPHGRAGTGRGGARVNSAIDVTVGEVAAALAFVAVAVAISRWRGAGLRLTSASPWSGASCSSRRSGS